MIGSRKHWGQYWNKVSLQTILEQSFSPKGNIGTKFLSKGQYWNKVSLQTSLERNSSNFSYISLFLCVNFEKLTVKFHVPYILNKHFKIRSNWMLFTIRSIKLFFIHNFRLQKLEILTFVWWHSNWFFIFLKFCKHEGYNKNI